MLVLQFPDLLTGIQIGHGFLLCLLLGWFRSGVCFMGYWHTHSREKTDRLRVSLDKGKGSISTYLFPNNSPVYEVQEFARGVSDIDIEPICSPPAVIVKSNFAENKVSHSNLWQMAVCKTSCNPTSFKYIYNVLAFWTLCYKTDVVLKL